MAIFEVFYQPGKLFASLPERRGAWIAPLLVSLLITLLTVIVAVDKIGMETIVRQQMERSSANMSPEQMQQAIDRSNTPAVKYVVYGVTMAASVMAPLLVAAGLAIFGLMATRQPKFGTTFSMVTLAYLPYGVIVSLMTILVVFASPDASALDFQNLLSTNVGAFMNKETTSKGLYALFSSLDVLTFGEMGLLAYGFSKITRSSVFFGLVSIGCLWGLYVVIKMGLSLL
jgi:hypothetical protein